MIFIIKSDKDKKKPTGMAAPAKTKKDKALVCVGIFTRANSTVNNISLPYRGRQTS